MYIHLANVDKPNKYENLVDSTTVDDISSLSIQPKDNVIGIANFPNEALVSTEVLDGVPGQVAQVMVDEYQDIKRYFERPRLYASFSASATRGNIVRYDVYNPITQFWPAAAYGRLNGVFGYKATIKFTLTVAATPFHQGLINLSAQYGTNSFSGSIQPRSFFPPLVTNIPHVNLDITESTMAELDVPYLGQYDFFELANTTSSGGDNILNANIFPYVHFAITQLLPTPTLTAAAAPTLRLYVSLHDMVLYGAVPVTASAVIPQSNLTGHMNKQSASGSLHTISKVSDTVGKVGTMLGIPMVGAAATTVSWLTEKMAKTAKSFGYSKPIIEDPPGRIMPLEYGSEHHVDQPSSDYLLSPYQSNRLEVSDFSSSSQVDEMALSYVLGKYCQCFVGNMTTGDAAGVSLYATNLCPTSLWFRTNSGRPGGNVALPASSTLTTNCFCPTTICYISQMFKYWRGSIKFKFHFAKTKFHAGRVIAAFVPATYDGNSSTVLSNNVPTPEIASGLVQPFQYSEVFDLRDASSFEFEVPYISSRPWLSTFGTVGGVSLSIVDPLIANGEASTSINFMVEVCAGEDFDLGCFVGSGLAPFAGVSSAAAVYQSGLDSKVKEIVQYTMGEKISSLKELIMIPYNLVINIPGASVTSTIFPHWAYKPAVATATPMSDAVVAYYTLSTGNVISAMYAFVTGGSSYSGYFSNPVIATVQSDTWDSVVASIPFYSSRAKSPLAKPRHIVSSYNRTFHVKQPSYQKAARVMTNQLVASTNWTPTTEPSYPNEPITTFTKLFVDNTGNAGVTKAIYGIAAADDSRCFSFIGPPPCYLFQSTRTNSIEAANQLSW